MSKYKITYSIEVRWGSKNETICVTEGNYDDYQKAINRFEYLKQDKNIHCLKLIGEATK